MKPVPIGRFTDTPSYEELQQEIARLRLTDEEREAVEYFANFQWTMLKPHSATLRKLLERLQ
jgi:hypothetical protein